MLGDWPEQQVPVAIEGSALILGWLLANSQLGHNLGMVLTHRPCAQELSTWCGKTRIGTGERLGSSHYIIMVNTINYHSGNGFDKLKF